MRINRKFLFTFLLLGLGTVLLALPSCHKKKDEEKAYMSGTLTYDVWGYYTVGTTVNLSAGGITSPAAGVTYTWHAEGCDPDTVEAVSCTLRLPLKKGNYTITCTAMADGYYNVIKTRTVNMIGTDIHAALSAVDPSKTGYVQGENTFTDPRDGKSYDIRRYAQTEWFVQNLNWAGAGKPYYGEEALTAVTGRYYNWEEARTACPEGWRLPTAEDWCLLARENNGGVPLAFTDAWQGLATKLCANVKLNDKKIWPYHPYNEKTNESGWNGLACGYGPEGGCSWTGIWSSAYWWTAAEQSAEDGIFRYIHYAEGGVPCAAAPKKAFYCNVRCVR